MSTAEQKRRYQLGDWDDISRCTLVTGCGVETPQTKTLREGYTMNGITKQEITHYLAIGELNTLLSTHPLHYYGFVSFCKNSTPSTGSPTIPRGKLIEYEAFNSLLSIQEHKNGFTIKTKQGNIRFWESKEFACSIHCIRGAL